MDFYRFIGSTAIREHLQTLDYRFSTPEAAYVVYFAPFVPLQEKIDAWQEIIVSMPNCALDERANMPAIPNFHQALQSYIALQQRKIERFLDAQDVVYLAGSIRINGHISPYGSTCCATFAQCRDTLVRDAQDCPNDVINWFEIERLRYQESESDMGERCYVNRDGEILDVTFGATCTNMSDEERDIDDMFRSMWFDIPTPFHAGDLVCSCENRKDPFVLTDLSTWGEARYRSELPDGIYSEHYITSRDKTLGYYRARGDDSDMCAYGFQLSAYNAKEDFFLFNDEFSVCHYLNLDYFQGELEVAQRPLLAVRHFLQNRSGIEFLINTYSALAQGAVCSQLAERLGKVYAGEGLAGAGIDAPSHTPSFSAGR